MLYLNKLIIHNFKSFRNATIKFSGGFNCIVGPNGSGKSNICDSLLFVLGESSLRRIRATSTAQLVSEVKVPKRGEGRRAYVSLVLGGDEEVTVTRMIKPNGKIAYRLNGKHMTRQEITDYLRTNNCMISDTNTITQGEIVKILNLNPKERRELIDIASGIKEFEDKKQASQKELDTVEEKITNTKVMLGERLGFLEELKKEKDAAEKYSKASQLMKQTNYTILYKRSEALQSELKDIIERLSDYEKKVTDIKSKITEYDVMAEKLAMQRNNAAKALNERSSTMNDVNRKLEEAKRNMAVSESEMESIKANEEESNSTINSLKEEIRKNAENLEKNSKIIPVLESDIANLKKEIESSNANAVSTQGKEDIEAYEKSMLNMENISKSLESMKKEAMELRSAISDLDAQKRSISAELDRIEKELSESRTKEQDIIDVSNSSNRELASARKELDDMRSRKKSIEAELQQLSDKRMALRESIATYGGDSNKVGKALSERIKKGFYGKAIELCRYDPRYSEAISAAAGARLNYFVVDNVNTADLAVRILRENRMGRAAFIPLDMINYSESPKINDGEPLIDYVEFDPKFAKAFKFIFSNTYLVGDIKSVGKNNRHRFVTMEGEILEQSGVVSGGFSRSFNYAKAISELKDIEEREKSLRAEFEGIQGVEDDARQRFGKAETVVMSSSMEIETIRTNIKRLEYEKSNRSKEFERISKDMDGKTATYNAHDIEIRRLEKELDTAKNENAINYKKLSGRFASDMDDQKIKDADKKLKEYTEKLEKSMTEKAALAKESDMVSKRIDELKSELLKREEALKNSNRKYEELKSAVAKLSEEAKTLEESIRAHDKKSAGMYEEIKKIEEEINKIGFDKGKLASEKERMERESIGMQATKSQLQTRLSDIMAELSGYEKYDIIDGDIDQLEKELYRLKAELESMGSVNMRAPEMYMEKSKDVEEVQDKIMTLESERNSILSMISELESRKLEVFNETFEKVNRKFVELYGVVFTDGKGSIALENPKEPFNSGLVFDMVEGKAKRHADRLSGGEKSMLMLILILAIQMCKPLAFYIFDEIDTALDKQNSKTLSALIKRLSANSQFIVVSHNDTLISYADTAIGVAKKGGESNVFGVEIVSTKEISK